MDWMSLRLLFESTKKKIDINVEGRGGMLILALFGRHFVGSEWIFPLSIMF